MLNFGDMLDATRKIRTQCKYKWTTSLRSTLSALLSPLRGYIKPKPWQC